MNSQTGGAFLMTLGLTAVVGIAVGGIYHKIEKMRHLEEVVKTSHHLADLRKLVGNTIDCRGTYFTYTPGQPESSDIPKPFGHGGGPAGCRNGDPIVIYTTRNMGRPEKIFTEANGVHDGGNKYGVYLTGTCTATPGRIAIEADARPGNRHRIKDQKIFSDSNGTNRVHLQCPP